MSWDAIAWNRSTGRVLGYEVGHATAPVPVHLLAGWPAAVRHPCAAGPAPGGSQRGPNAAGQGAEGTCQGI